MDAVADCWCRASEAVRSEDPWAGTTPLPDWVKIAPPPDGPWELRQLVSIPGQDREMVASVLLDGWELVDCAPMQIITFRRRQTR